jgi:uncharacterized protein DUF2845
MMRILVPVMVCLAAVAAAPAPAQAVELFHCGSHRVRTGERTFEVLERCGDPDAADQRVDRRTTRRKTGRCGPGGETITEEQTVEVLVDEWVYDFGQNHYLRTLHFENGVLTSILSRWVGSR